MAFRSLIRIFMAAPRRYIGRQAALLDADKSAVVATDAFISRRRCKKLKQAWLFTRYNVPLVTSSQKILSLAVKSTSKLGFSLAYPYFYGCAKKIITLVAKSLSKLGFSLANDYLCTINVEYDQEYIFKN